MTLIEAGPEVTVFRSVFVRGRGFGRRFWVSILLALIGLTVSGAITLTHSQSLSPLDEWVYADYLYKVPQELYVRKGEPVGIEARNLIACKGVSPYGPIGPPCGGDYSDPSKFPFGGITSADPYTPVYFIITRVVGDGIHLLTHSDQLTGWRLTGPLWLAGTMIAFVALLRRWKVNSAVIVGLGLAFIGSPFSFWTYSYVSTDVTAFLFGALLLLVATRILQGNRGGWWFPVLAALAAAFKITNLLGVALAALYLVIGFIVRRVAERREPPILMESRASRLAPLSFAVLGSGVAIGVQLGWLAIDRATAISTATAAQGIATTLTFREFITQSVNFLPGTITSNVVVSGTDGYALSIPGFVTAPLSWICIAGVIGIAWRIRNMKGKGPLVLAVVIAAFAFAPLLGLALQVFLGGYFTLPSRYGASILAGFLLLAGMSIRNRWIGWGIALYGAAMCAISIHGSIVLSRF